MAQVNRPQFIAHGNQFRVFKRIFSSVKPKGKPYCRNVETWKQI